MENSLFLVLGIFFTLALFGGVAYMAQRFKPQWNSASAKGKMVWGGSIVVSLAAVIYIAVRCYMIAFTAGDGVNPPPAPGLILGDFFVLMIMSGLTAVTRLLEMKKNNNPRYRQALVMFNAILLAEVFCLILWLLHIAITPDLFMFIFFALLAGLSVPFFFAKAQPREPKGAKDVSPADPAKNSNQIPPPY